MAVNDPLHISGIVKEDLESVSFKKKSSTLSQVAFILYLAFPLTLIFDKLEIALCCEPKGSGQ